MAQEPYDLKAIAMTVDRVPVTGAGDGDKLAIEYGGDEISRTVGSDGETMVSVLNYPNSTWTFTLHYGSRLNEKFQELLDAGPRRRFSVQAFDTHGALDIQGDDCVIQARPPIALGREVGTIQWVISAGITTSKVGALRTL